MENFLLDNYSYYSDHCNVFHIKIMVSNNPKNVTKVSINIVSVIVNYHIHLLIMFALVTIHQKLSLTCLVKGLTMTQYMY